jgi:hypothetical protein
LRLFDIGAFFVVEGSMIRIQQTKRCKELGKGGSEAPQVDGKRIIGPCSEEEFGGAVWPVKE